MRVYVHLKEINFPLNIGDTGNGYKLTQRYIPWIQGRLPLSIYFRFLLNTFYSWAYQVSSGLLPVQVTKSRDQSFIGKGNSFHDPFKKNLDDTKDKSFSLM